MIKKINTAIAKNGIWIFLGAATYKFVFLIISIVNSFKYSGAGGVRTLFQGMFDYALELAILAILLELSAKLAGVVIESKPIFQQPQQPLNNYNNQIPAQQAPVQQMPVQQVPVPQAPVQQTPVQQAPVQEAPVQQAPAQQAPAQETPAPQSTAASVWFCSNCGTQNEGASNFCYKCGKPK